MYVCLCNRITDRQIRDKAASEDCSRADMHQTLGTTPKCGKCIPMMRDIVREMMSIYPSAPAFDPVG